MTEEDKREFRFQAGQFADHVNIRVHRDRTSTPRHNCQDRKPDTTGSTGAGPFCHLACLTAQMLGWNPDPVG